MTHFCPKHHHFCYLKYDFEWSCCLYAYLMGSLITNFETFTRYWQVQHLSDSGLFVKWKSMARRRITWTTKLRLWQSRNILTFHFVLAAILSLTVEKLIWSLEVKRSTSLNQRQVKRLLIGTCSLKMTHPSGTSTDLHHYKSLKCFDSYIIMLRKHN